jgi:hypothetical protein
MTEKPKSAVIAGAGINSTNLSAFLSALLGDILTGRIQPDAAQIACIASDQLLRALVAGL